MQKPVRDSLIMITVFLIGTGLLVGWAYWVGLIPRRLDALRRDSWIVLAMLPASEILFLCLNVWAIRIILCLIIFPTLAVARMEAAHATRYPVVCPSDHLVG
jgi:hypothetical protein